MYIRLQTLLRSVQNLRPCINDTNLLQPVGTNVPKGDQDKEVALESTLTSSYVAQPRSCVPYDKSIVVENLRKTNFTLVDGLGTFDNYRSTATDSYNSKYQKGKCSITHNEFRHRKAEDRTASSHKSLILPPKTYTKLKTNFHMVQCSGHMHTKKFIFD